MIIPNMFKEMLLVIVLHSGTGKMLESLVFKEFQCKVRSIELNVLQTLCNAYW